MAANRWWARGGHAAVVGWLADTCRRSSRRCNARGSTCSFPCRALLPCRWSLQKGYVPLPKSNHAERQRTNLDVFRWGTPMHYWCQQS